MRATIERKTIRAPFSGVLGIRQVNLGQYLAAGDPIVPLAGARPDLRQLLPAAAGRGHAVRVGVERAGHGRRVDGRSVALTGKITAIDSVVDEATRNVQVQATFANPAGTLRPGMFVEAECAASARSSAVIAAAGLRRSATRPTATRSSSSRT